MRITRIVSALLTMCIIALLSGCTQEQSEQKVIIEFENLTVLETSFNNDAGKHANEYEPWTREKKTQEREKSESKAPKSFTVEFNGIKYTGEFSGTSSKVVPFNYIEYHYETNEFSFSINANTKELTRFSLEKKSDSEQKLDEGECREIADNFASKYIDVNAYNIITENDEEANSCKFSYERNVSGLNTPEGLYITVDGNGNIIHFQTKMLHDFDNVVAIEFDESKIIDAIDAKLATIYKDVDSYEGYTVQYYCAVKLDNGEFGIMYNIVAELGKVYSGDGSSFHYNRTYIRLLITGATVKPAE